MTVERADNQAGERQGDRLRHITVCICTFRRPKMLALLLEKLESQETNGCFTYSIVVTDNDRDQPALPVVEQFRAGSSLAVKYCVEPRQNIARARNAAVRAADGDFVAFIDDDEFPSTDWLLRLFVACKQEGVAGVLGPVIPHFSPGAPKWLFEGGFYDRPRHPTGTQLDWKQTRTGNTLLRATLFAAAEPFNAECLSGSDIDFFKRKMEDGQVFRWCDEAVVYEVVPPARWTRSFLVRRNLFRGMFSARNQGFPVALLWRSLLAVPAYAAVVPFTLVMGQAFFMRHVCRLSYHFGRLVALTGINPIRKPYVTD